MPNLLNLSKNEKFESNSILQIKNQKEIRAEKTGKSSSFAEGCEIFAEGCENAFLDFLLF